MKKIYALIVVTLCLALTSHAQNYHWIGAANGSWTSGSNWSLTQGGAAAGNYPSDNTDNAIFHGSAQVDFNTTIEINSLTVAGTASNVKITGTGATDRFL